MDKINIRPFVLHVRLTKACNADCSYCSSWQESPDNRLTPEKFKESFDWILEQNDKNGIKPTHFSVNYVGGEILLIPNNELISIVNYVRNRLSGSGIACHDGVQTNLIGSKRKIDFLYDLFDGRVGTSVDNFTSDRTVKGSSSKYRVFFASSEEHIKESKEGIVPPAIITVTAKNIKHVIKEAQIANRKSRDISFRPVFKGGLSTESISNEDLVSHYLEIFDRWFLKYGIIIEPFFSLLKKLLQKNHGVISSENMEMCPFQSDCTKKSLNLEPNGDLYICQEMSDSQDLILGNAIKKEFNDDLYSQVSKRYEHIEKICGTCEYYKVCHGGCMHHSIQSGLGMYDKTPYCALWLVLLREMDKRILKEEVVNIEKWIRSLEKR